MSNQQKDNPPSSTSGAGSMSRSDTTSPGGAVPVQGQSGTVGSGVAGRAGGTDAAAGASMGGDGGQGLRQKGKDDTGGPRGDQLSNAVGAAAAAAGGTGLGEVNSAGDTRTGTSSGQAGSPTGGDPSNGSIPPPTNKGGASAG